MGRYSRRTRTSKVGVGANILALVLGLVGSVLHERGVEAAALCFTLAIPCLIVGISVLGSQIPSDTGDFGDSGLDGD